MNKQWRVYLDFGQAGSLSLQLYRTYNRLLHMREAVNNHALPIYTKNRIASLLCIFESTIPGLSCKCFLVGFKAVNDPPVPQHVQRTKHVFQALTLE